MGYYIQAPTNRNKAAYLVSTLGGQQLVSPPASFNDIPTGKALIVVVDNMAFEAAGLCYNADEFEVFTGPDRRPRQYVLLDKAVAYELSGYKGIAR